jgi:hypothetical protein
VITISPGSGNRRVWLALIKMVNIVKSADCFIDGVIG